MRELDPAIIKLVIKGDRNAFRKLYDHYAPFIWRIVYPMVGRDMNAAKDVLQDVFIKVYRSLPGFKGQSSLSTWIYRIAYNTVMARSRKPVNRYKFQCYTDTYSGTDRSDGFDERQLTEKVLASLSGEDRFLLIAREVHNIPFEDLAAITGHNSGALRIKLHRLKESIRQSYPQYCYSGSEE